MDTAIPTAEHLVRFWRNKFIDERVQMIRRTNPSIEYELAVAEAEHAAHCCESVFADEMRGLA